VAVTFSKFLARAIPSFRPTPAQRVLVAVSFDGIDPVALPEGDRSIAEKLFGPVDTIPPAARRIVLWVKGARIGGSLLCAYRLVHLAETVSLRNVAPGEQAAGIIVGPDTRLARQPLRYALGGANSAGFSIESETQDSFVMVRSDGRRVSIECLPATRGGSAVRGRTLVGAIVTEASFFRDENYQVNDVEVVRGIRPRLAHGGAQLLGESTPFAELGWVHDIHAKNFGQPSGALVAEAPTTLLRPDEETAAFVAEARADDPINAAREHDCKFLSAGSGFFFDGQLLDDCIDEDLAHPTPFDPRAAVVSSADFGFVSDSSALAIVQVAEDAAWLALAEELQPMPGAPLRPSEVSRQFAASMARYNARELVTDGHYIESIREHVEPYEIEIVRSPDGQSGKLEAFLAARQLIADKKIRIPSLPRLVAQLKSVISRPVSGGGLSISIPRRKGLAHGDLASAFVLSCWAARSHMTSPGWASAMGKIIARSPRRRDEDDGDRRSLLGPNVRRVIGRFDFYVCPECKRGFHEPWCPQHGELRRPLDDIEDLAAEAPEDT